MLLKPHSPTSCTHSNLERTLERMQQDKQIPQEEQRQLSGQVGKQLISSVHNNAVWIHGFFFFCFLAERDEKHCLCFNYLRKTNKKSTKISFKPKANIAIWGGVYLFLSYVIAIFKVRIIFPNIKVYLAQICLHEVIGLLYSCNYFKRNYLPNSACISQYCKQMSLPKKTLKK